MNRWGREQQKAWRQQIFKVQTWRQVRGPAGAGMCETRKLGYQVVAVAHVATQVAVDMRVVCPQDVMKILLKQVRRLEGGVFFFKKKK